MSFFRQHRHEGVEYETGDVLTFDRYHTVDVMYEWLERWAEQYPNLVDLYELGRLVADLTGSALPVSQPVIGSGIYQVESGIPATWWLRVRDTHPTEAFPVLPALLGRQDVEVVLGKGSGIDSVDAWLRRLGMEASTEQIAQLIVLVKEKSMEKKGLLSQEEFREIADQYLAA